MSQYISELFVGPFLRTTVLTSLSTSLARATEGLRGAWNGTDASILTAGAVRREVYADPWVPSKGNGKGSGQRVFSKRIVKGVRQRGLSWKH